ncbi:MAG: PD-(D/E)XK nuclease family protein [Promicromonosporaceae bacterium]|nr:PD-(D/E)XK nuclease family protein [Promicromonosporaceae bacterium]
MMISVVPRLVAPVTQATALPALDGAQRVAFDAARTAEALLIVGAPGTGRTTLACAIAVAAVTDWGLDPARVLVLAASRRAAARLRDQVTAASSRTLSAPMVRTVASAAFGVLCSRAQALGAPLPTLISGPEQDLLLAELLAGHLDGDGPSLALPPGLPPEALGLRGFRHELRDLLMRAAERGLDPLALAELAERHQRPEWLLGARIYEEYLDVLALRGATPDIGERLDPAVVVEEATQALAAWMDELPGLPRPAWELVIVDDYQEATAATARLLHELAGPSGARLVLLADPDSAVQGFRGAAPTLVGRATASPSATEPGQFGAKAIMLDTAWRQTDALRAITKAVTERISTLGGPLHRRATAGKAELTPGAAPPTGTKVAILSGAAKEAAHIAYELRFEHLIHGTPWNQMAVIARSSAALAVLRRDLIAASVPVALLGSDVPLREEPAVTPLLAALRIVAHNRDNEGSPLTPDVAAALLTSPLGGLDAVGLRRLRRSLRAEELNSGGGRSSETLLAEVLAAPEYSAMLAEPVRRAPHAVAKVLAAGRTAAAAPDANAQTVLWAIWAATGLAERWRELALAGGAAGARADRDLDAVLALFRAAETYLDRLPGASVSSFVDYLTSQELAADSLAAIASGAQAVEALTPAGAAGREWEFVVVAGVQDGVWPDLRLRDSLFGAQTLVELLSGRVTGAQATDSQARRQVLDDELRAFAVATSRATRRLLVTAVADAEESPSVFCNLVEPVAEGEADSRLVEVKLPLDLRGVVAQARSELIEAVVRAGDGTKVATLLAELATCGIAEADPQTWYGTALASTDAPLWVAGAPVSVSPSKVEAVETCPLRWALEAAGGIAADDTAQSLGSLLHKIAQDLPEGTLPELSAALDRKWPTLALTPGWPATQLRRRAEGMIRHLAEYLGKAGEPIVVEAGFELTVGRARLRGKADRVELGPNGSALVADLKTGRQAPSVAKAEENPQLGAYQLAVTGGALGPKVPAASAGARLVYVGTDNAKPALRTQPPLVVEADGSSWASRLVEAVADTMAANQFAACPNDLCRTCPVRRSCPLQPAGRNVIA